MPSPQIITIGNFDGVHVGHQAILHRARQLADERNAGVLAVTFEPTPIEVLRPEHAPPRISSLTSRIAKLKAAGADEVLLLKPTPELLGLSAHAFIQQLIDEHYAVGFVEGEDFQFGNNRSGDIALLQTMGEQQGFTVAALPRVSRTLSDQLESPISSSLTRWLIGRGRVEDATICLGHPFEIQGKVVQGEQRGRTIDIPTANLDPAALQGMIVPMDGVYGGAVTLSDGQTYPAAISVGNKPTFGHDQLTVEAHLIGYSPRSDQQADYNALYGQTLTYHFAHWIRDQYPFPDVKALIAQLQSDIQTAGQLYENSAWV